jgi:hypothetical protein
MKVLTMTALLAMQSLLESGGERRCQVSGRLIRSLSVVLSHPFARKKRMDGAQGAVGDLAGGEMLGSERCVPVRLHFQLA